MGKALQGLGQTHQEQARIGVRVQKVAARRQCDMGAVVAPHAVNSQCDHATGSWPVQRPGGVRRAHKRQRPVLRNGSYGP